MRRWSLGKILFLLVRSIAVGWPSFSFASWPAQLRYMTLAIVLVNIICAIISDLPASVRTASRLPVHALTSASDVCALSRPLLYHLKRVCRCHAYFLFTAGGTVITTHAVQGTPPCTGLRIPG